MELLPGTTRAPVRGDRPEATLSWERVYPQRAGAFKLRDQRRFRNEEFDSTETCTLIFMGTNFHLPRFLPGHHLLQCRHDPNRLDQAPESVGGRDGGVCAGPSPYRQLEAGRPPERVFHGDAGELPGRRRVHHGAGRSTSRLFDPRRMAAKTTKDAKSAKRSSLIYSPTRPKAFLVRVVLGEPRMNTDGPG